MDVLIPWRDSGCEYRRANFEAVRRLYEGAGFRVVTGDSDPGAPFCRSAARNAAAAASDAEALVFVDADAVIQPDRLEQAARFAVRDGRLVRPFAVAGFLTAAASRRFLSGGLLTPEFAAPPVQGFIGLAWALPRSIFEALGGFDPGFVGYGGEDNAFSHVCEALFGPAGDVPGRASSLWHPAERVTSDASWERLRAYWRVQTWDDYRALRPDLEG